MRFSMTKFYKHIVINVDKKRVVHRKYRKYKGATISNNTAGWSNSDDNSLQCHSSWGWMMLVLVTAGWFLKKRKLRIKDRKDSTWPSISNNRAGRSNSIKKLKVPTSILCSKYYLAAIPQIRSLLVGCSITEGTILTILSILDTYVEYIL